MKRCTVLVLAVALFLALTASCTSMRSLTAVKANYDMDQEEDGWASRYIPGVKALSKLIPPPTDARKKWDDHYRRWNHPRDSSEISPEF
ncbi:MAG: hypothetical protein V1792_13170 [Pseudomonadota bacterium]